MVKTAWIAMFGSAVRNGAPGTPWENCVQLT